ncbi:hypothetical protein, partial [Aeromonas sp. QDB11]|uniref:hypothetical protein n=1 Tax=Aeromonas sp. QDB11 TaxID=2990482 RepID=UPI0022E0201F
DAVPAGRKMVIGMMLLADRHDVISHNVKPDKIKGNELIKKATEMGDKQATTYSKMFIENDLPKILADEFSNILDILSKGSLTGSKFAGFVGGAKDWCK